MLQKASAKNSKQNNRWNPYLLGVLLAVLLLGFTAAQQTLFPQLDPSPGQHNSEARDAFFTLLFFLFLVDSLWRLRKRVSLWISISMLFGLHVFGLVIYDTYFQPLSLWQWDFVVLAEIAVVMFLLDSLMKRLDRLYRKKYS